MSRVPIHDHSNIHQGGKIRSSTADSSIGPSTSVSPGAALPVAAVDVSIADAGSLFASFDVEAALAELANKAIGYQAHGNLGATETFDALTGWHSGTLNANCTITLTGAPTATVSSLFLELIQDGTGGWTITLPASVSNRVALEAAQDTTLSTTSFLVLLSRDGGTTWYGGWWGGSGVTTADYLVGTAQTGLSAEIVVGTTPGGELGGTWASPTVDATHSGSTHAATQAAAEATAAAALAAHVASGGGELLISDTPSTPLIFADILQNEAQTELLYAG